MSEHIKWTYWRMPTHDCHVRWAFGEMIDDGRVGYKNKCLCFNCQRVFRPADRKHDLSQCPNCHSTKIKVVGPMFKPPRSKDDRSWKQLRKRFKIT